MSKGDDLEVAVAARLRAVMKAFGIDSNPKMGEICDASPNTVNNWINAYNLPRVNEAIRLCERTGITLDWLYRGAIHNMDPARAIALGALVDANGH